ncbi:hypothetical protein [Aquabacterium sp.]|uniref:hypothetical protein n=1 Tax=Aquabacterium sp. TaxID=1872578 RepID=UPI0019997D0B|nr:hypothetical protein [Aquabacterium sp.]MBC7699019.1 hypothetical protein [Aquabacterium sp.]
MSKVASALRMPLSLTVAASNSITRALRGSSFRKLSQAGKVPLASAIGSGDCTPLLITSAQTTSNNFRLRSRRRSSACMPPWGRVTLADRRRLTGGSLELLMPTLSALA